VSLNEARSNFAAFGAKSREFVPNVRELFPEGTSGVDGRPLRGF